MNTRKLLKSLLIMPLILGLNNCSEDTTSKPSFVHKSDESMVLSTMGLIETLSFEQVEKNFSKIDVCVVNQKSESISDEELLFEVRLAHVMWLHSANVDPRAWELFNFSIQSECSLNKVDYQSVIVFPDSDELTSDVRGVVRQSGMTPPAYGRSFILGIGGGGGASYQWRGPQFYFNISSVSRIVMNPYFQWRSLKDVVGDYIEILKNKDGINYRSENWRVYQHLVQLKMSNLGSWEKLLGLMEEHEGSLAWDDLLIVVNGLQESRLLLASPNGLEKRASFDTLLHEVGHQFGMGHAHTISTTTDFNGESELTEKIELDVSYQDGSTKKLPFYKTEEASMAYGNRYLHLSPDDIEGIKSAKQGTKRGVHELRFKYSPSDAKSPIPSSLLN